MKTLRTTRRRTANQKSLLRKSFARGNNHPQPEVKQDGAKLVIKIPLTTPARAKRNGAEAAKPVLTKPAPWQNPTQLDRPAFMLNFPFSYATGAPNNPWMTDLSDDKRAPDFKRAAVQFLQLYQNMAAEGLVYLLPTPRKSDLQDLLYTANLGIVLEHLPNKRTVVISNFMSPPRQGETPLGVKFFHDMGYEVHVAPAKFEGEAELKHLYDNVYVGGY